MDDITSAQIAASAYLQEGEDAIKDFMEVFVKTFGEGMRAPIEQFKRSCMAHGRLQVTLENTLRNDISNKEKEG